VSISRTTAIKQGLRLEVLTIAWMLAEAVIAIGAGVVARSVLLTAFGVDSVIELLSGIVLFRRLSVEAAGGSDAAVERLEARTKRISALLLVALCAYVVLSSIAGLALRIMPSGSIVGIAVAGIALVAMPLLARAKRGVNRVLESPSLRADIAETISCAYLAAVTLAGLAASMLLGWWWAQYVAALALLVWLIPETREALAEQPHNGSHQGGKGIRDE
jgi:divalent metal cation (Fe/Co/Zn/Cd) transporter